MIDDEALLRRTLRAILEKGGHAVEEAKDGEQGLRRFVSSRPDLVLMDIVMPERDGLETLADIRKRDPLVPIIAMSGGGAMGGGLFLQLAGQMGATRTMAKPIRAADLLAVVRELVGDAPADRPGA